MVASASGTSLEERGHFLGRLQVKFGAVIAHPVFVIDLRARLDAKQNVVRGGVVLADVMDVVRRDDFQAELLAVLEQFRGDLLLLGNAVVGDLEVKIAGREDVLEIVDRLLGLLRAARHDVPRHLARQAGAGPDEAFVYCASMSLSMRGL